MASTTVCGQDAAVNTVCLKYVHFQAELEKRVSHLVRYWT